MAEKEQSLINHCRNQNPCGNEGTWPALSYLKTLKTSSTAHVLRNIAADFVKNEEQHLAKSSCRKTEGAGPESINCLTQRLYPCTRSSVMPSLKKDSFGRLSNLSAVAIETNLQTNHFTRAIP